MPESNIVYRFKCSALISELSIIVEIAVHYLLFRRDLWIQLEECERDKAILRCKHCAYEENIKISNFFIDFL